MIKNISLFLYLALLSSTAFSQENVEALVKEGIQFHDQGKYDEAIQSYKKALKIDPNSPLVHYELSMTYMYSKDYQKSLEHSDQVIKLDKDYRLMAYITKGSCLDNMGKTKESIKLFKKGIKKFGDHHLLYYNLALNYYKEGEKDLSAESAKNAINTNFSHPSSHFLLGFIMAEQERKAESLMSIHYFLFLEPNTKRSQNAFQLIKELYGDGIEKGEGTDIQLFLNPDAMKNEFGSIEMLISLVAASRHTEEHENKSDEEFFIEQNDSFFKVLGETKKKKDTGLYWESYVPFFYELAKSDHLDTYSYYISQSSSEIAHEWLKENDAGKMEAFVKWLEEEN